MRGQRPRRGREVEVVVLQGIAIRRRHRHRQHELALLPGVADQRRGQEMRGRLRRAFRRRTQAHDHRPVRHIHDALCADDRVDRVDDLAVFAFQPVVRDGVALQRTQHGDVVVRIGNLQLLRGHDLRRELAHRRARFHELDLGALHQQLRIDVDAHLLELERVHRRRQLRVVARPGQHFAAGPFGVVAQLLAERVQRRLRALDLVFREQVVDALDVGIAVRQRLFDFHLAGASQARIAEAFGVAVLRQLHQWRGICGHAGVALQARERMRAAFGRGLVGEQGLQAGEHVLAHVRPRQHVLLVERAVLDVAVRGVDQDLQVLAHVRAFLDRELGLQFGLGLRHRRAKAFADLGLEIEDLVVVAGDAEERGFLRRERRLRLEQDLRERVAARDPGRRRGRGSRRRIGRTRGGRNGNGKTDGEGDGEAQRQGFHGGFRQAGTPQHRALRRPSQAPKVTRWRGGSRIKSGTGSARTAPSSPRPTSACPRPGSPAWPRHRRVASPAARGSRPASGARWRRARGPAAPCHRG